MNEIGKVVLKLAGTEITGWDGLIALLICGFVEYVVKRFFKKADEKVWNTVVRLAPVALGLIVYIIIAIAQKTGIPIAILHGLGIGLLTSGAYASLLSLLKEVLKEGITTANDKASKILKDEKSK